MGPPSATQHCGTAAKATTGLSLRLGCYSFNQAPCECARESSRGWSTCLDPCHSHGRPGLSGILCGSVCLGLGKWGARVGPLLVFSRLGIFFLTGLPLATTLNAWKHPSSECCKSEKGGSKCMKDLHFGQDVRVAFVVD